MGGQRVGHGLDKASEILDISKDALRKRIYRKTVEAEKNERGEWIVYLDHDKMDNVQDKVDKMSSVTSTTEKDILIEHLKQELENKQKTIDSLIKQAENSQILLLGLQQQNQLLLEGSSEKESKEKRNFFFWNKAK